MGKDKLMWTHTAESTAPWLPGAMTTRRLCIVVITGGYIIHNIDIDIDIDVPILLQPI